jgi:glycosyltransferase involved in cell wall biosynthesis
VIYICIPAHNEERTIGVLLWKIRQVLADFPRDYQILVANDGSSDDTAEVLGPYQRVLPLTVVRIEKRGGYANALELLVREAVRRAEYPKRDVIVTLQADFTDDPAELTPMLKKIEAGADVVCANSKIPESASRTVRWGNRIGKFLLRRRGWPEGVTDPLSGLRVYRVLAVKRAIEARGPERLLTWEGWAANAELLQLVQPHARRTEAVETSWRGERHQRASRLTFWSLVGLLNRFARGGLGPLAGVPLELPSATVDLRKERTNRGQRTHSGRAGASARSTEPGREPQSRERTPRREGSEKARHEMGEPRAHRQRSKPERAERTQRERPPRSERTRPVKEQPDAAGNGATAPAPIEAGVENGAPQAPPVRKKRRRRRRRAEGAAPAKGPASPTETVAAVTDAGGSESGDGEEPGAPPAETNGAPKKRRSRRGGRGRRGRRGGARNTEASLDNNVVGDVAAPPPMEGPTTTLETGSDN